MSDATIIANQLQDIVSSLDDVAVALRAVQPTVTIDVPEQAAPNITMEAQIPATVVNIEPVVVPAPVVNVPQIAVPPPVIKFVPAPAAPPAIYNVRITERDENGYIAAFTITPV